MFQLGIATGIDKLLDLVQDKKKITLKKASKELNISEDKVETWGRILSDEELLDLKYPVNPLDPPFLQIKNYEEKSKKKKRLKKDEEEKKESKKKTRLTRKRKIKPRAFFRRFKSSSAKKRDYRPYKDKRKEVKKILEKEKQGTKKRKFSIVGNQLKLLAIVLTTIVMLVLIYVWGS